MPNILLIRHAFEFLLHLYLFAEISIQMPTMEDITNVNEITFPEDGKTQIFIPSEVLLDEIKKG